MSVDAIVDVGSTFLTEAAANVGSIITDLGTEFLSSAGELVTEVSQQAVASFGGFEIAGSLAGDASWFDAFNPGQILDKIPGVSGFDLGSITQGLPSLSEITKSVPSVSEFQGYLKTAQTAIKQITPAVQTVQNIAGYAGIQIPGTQILTQAAGAIGLAESGLSTAAGISGTVGKVVSAAGAVAGGESPLASIGGLIKTASSVPGLEGLSQVAGPVGRIVDGARAVAGAESPLTAIRGVFATAGPVDSGAEPPGLPGQLADARPVNYTLNELREMTDAESEAFAKKFNNGLVSFFNDPSLQRPQNYDAAVQSRDELIRSAIGYSSAISEAEQNIQSNNENIAAIEAELRDENLPDDRREELEAVLQANYENNAIQQNNLDTNLENLLASEASLASDQQIIAATDAGTIAAPGAVASQGASNFSLVKGLNGLYSLVDTVTGAVRRVGLTATQALEQIKNLGITSPAADSPSAAPVVGGVTGPDNIDVGGGFNPAGELPGTSARNLVQEARNQAAARSVANTAAQASDWRVRLRLAPNADYLYKNPNGAGILDALRITDGVIFPYTPSIETAYKANYDPYELTHSNYRGYFYKNSYVDAINMRATFTAQDTNEANYLLAVIHFFRSVTKMFYGNDSQRGSPPPLVYLSGYGDFQFNEHPCVVSQFNYTLPPDVDYIRAQSALSVNTDMLGNRLRNPIANNPLSYTANRLLNSGLLAGALDTRPSVANNLPTKGPTYVPTKMEISISMYPIQSRQQVSKNFSLKGFAQGNLLKAGYW